MDQLTYVLPHLKQSLSILFGLLGSWGYLILFLIIFAETGLVVFPWLPGESLIFFAASLASLPSSSLRMSLLVPTFFFAALIGDIVNYYIGRYLTHWQWMNKKINGPNLASARKYFDQYGGMAVVFGRFVPLIRTFIPLVAGIANLNLTRFTFATVVGVAIWVALASILGYYFGSLPFVQQHYALIVLLIILVAMLPAICTLIIHLIRRHIIKRNKMM
ncbi:MAG TPA: VTT domain-containing protein [Candidatus Limosilactobacillus merdipullorum]|uniref:VTT domain-containing protein n=1 Tax=Candidatus Limosilactobacillus merdipullorum TaxID=2838653 RepID=A0A9D1QNF5_9LACO|nr:VTT domain-containing protein [Candidatus Limosilactobacillus merdipullorum]